MTPRFLAWRMAWREARASAPKFLFVIFGVAAGVGALTGVRGFSAAFHGVLKREARTLMAADLTVRQFTEPTPGQLSKLDPWTRRGVRFTRITETVSMMGAGGDAPPVLVSLKAVDPKVYPFYGQVKLDTARPLAGALTADSIAVSDDLAVRLNLAPGGRVRLGSADFTVCGIVKLEPDRMTGSLNIGPRVLITRAGLDRTGLMVFGSRASERLLFKLPPAGVDVVQMRDALRNIFPQSQVADYREGNPFLSRSLEHSTTFLSLVSLIALIVGALGVATAIHSHLQQRLDTIAILKCVGARSGQIMRIYTLQTVVLGLAGGVAGVAVGAGVQKLFPLLLANYFQVGGIPWSSSFALEGIATGVLVTLLFTIPPLVAIRRVKPALIFRRDMAEQKPARAERLRRLLPAVATGALILAGIAGVAAWLSESARMGAYFVGALAAAFVVLGAVAWLLLRGLRLFLRWSPVRLPVVLRHGMANIYRPGNHAPSVLVALGIGVMFTLTIYLVQSSLLTEVTGAAPPGSPNVFLINITPKESDAVGAFLDAQKNLQSKPRLVPMISARLVSIDGREPERFERRGEHDYHGRGARSVTWMDAKPPDIQVLRGAWWSAGESAPLVSVSERAARVWSIAPGAALRWSAAGREFDARVVAVHRAAAVRMGADEDFIFDRAALAGLPAQWFGAARMAPKGVPGFQREAFRRFPTVTVINVADVLDTVQTVVDQVALVVRFISLFAILAGAIILASTVAGTRLRRSREAAVLKTLGARRARLVAIFSVEFAILGGVAGLMGGGLATVFSRVLLTRLLDASFEFELLPNLATILLTMTLALAAGWLASLRILRRRPLEILRDE
jgi:putative ABC transport system permease protein